MRKPKYLSYSAMDLFYKDREEYYLKYLADNRPPRMPQTAPMAVGSAFDAFCKSFLHDKFNDSPDPEFAADTIFNTQVEEQNRTECRPIGKYLFDCYRQSGALSDLVGEMSAMGAEPEFEISLEATIHGIPLLGKPDIHFKLLDESVIYDWKVNGYFSKSSNSPKPGFTKSRDGWNHSDKSPSRTHGKCHKDAFLQPHGSVMVNAGASIDSINPEWAGQLSMYSWLTGAPVGSKILCGVDQITGCGYVPGCKTDVRITSFRGYISPEFQESLLIKLSTMWQIINDGHIFADVSRSESDSRCKNLDGRYLAYDGTHESDSFIESIDRQHKNF